MEPRCTMTQSLVSGEGRKGQVKGETERPWGPRSWWWEGRPGVQMAELGGDDSLLRQEARGLFDSRPSWSKYMISCTTQCPGAWGWSEERCSGTCCRQVGRLCRGGKGSGLLFFPRGSQCGPPSAWLRWGDCGPLTFLLPKVKASQGKPAPPSQASRYPGPASSSMCNDS